jgi:uncharacterized protein (DUF1778 family)
VNPQQAQQPAGGTGRRSGRDRRHLSVRRRWRISSSFSDDEHTAIVAAAARMGLTPTGYVATAALAAARHHGGVVTGDERFEQLAGLQAELFDARTALNKVGGNLNQAVAVLNATGQAPMWLASAVRLVVRAVTTLDQVVTKIDRRLR